MRSGNLGSGKCTYILAVGELSVQCPCEHGVLGIKSPTATQGSESFQKLTNPLSRTPDTVRKLWEGVCHTFSIAQGKS
jgi:hypothetical protein